jgi:hypothetical protein
LHRIAVRIRTEYGLKDKSAVADGFIFAQTHFAQTLSKVGSIIRKDGLTVKLDGTFEWS